jgi:uncharacterized protein YbjT (DUF2867 family)
MRCAVAGATGLVGSELITQLLKDEAYEAVVAVGRRAPALEHAKLSSVIVDLGDPAALEAALAGIDDVYCCLGTTIKVAGSREAFRKVDFDYPLTLARAAQAAGAGEFLIVTAVGASSASGIFYNRVKGEVEDAIRALSFPRGVKIFRPSMLLGKRDGRRPLAAMSQAVLGATRNLFFGPMVRWRAIRASELAHAMRTAAREPAPAVAIYEGSALVDRSGAWSHPA